MSKDTVLANKSVLVKSGIITDIADSIIVEGIEIINGNNMFLSPGLIDMHTHLWDKQELGLYLANGVTAIRNLWGYPMHLRIKKALDNNEIIGPMLYVSSPKLTGKNDFGDDKVQVSTATEARDLVKNYKKRGYNFIKTYAGIPKNILDAIIEESIQSNISIVSHPSYEIPYLDQFHNQISSIEHAEEIVQQPLNYSLDSIKLEEVIKHFVVTEKTFCPTLTVYYKIYEMLNESESILESEDMGYMNPLIQELDTKAQYNRWQNEKEMNNSTSENISRQHKFHLYLVKQMNDAGVNVVCGTDAGIGITVPGFSIHQELGFYKEAGMSNFEALKTATINPAKTHKEFKLMGTIEKSKLANFVLTKKNPLKNIRVLNNPEWVMIKGRKIDMNLLNEFTKKAFDRNNLVATAIRYIEYMIIEK